MLRGLVLTATSGIVFLGLAAEQLKSVDLGQVLGAIGQVGWQLWLAAALATWVSFRAVAGYDLALHRHLGTGIAPARARRAGFAAIAIGQTVGLGVVSGTLVRWRLLPALGLVGAARLSLLVAFSFLGAWAVVTALVLLVLPVPHVAELAAPVLGVAAVLLAAAGLGLRPWMPNLITLARLLTLAAVDCGAAALALWLLVPGDIGLASFLPVFLLALGAGLVSGSPAGLGAFEIVLLGLLPGGHEALLAGVVAWRVLYYAVPALIGAGVALLAGGEGGCSAPGLAPPEIAEAGLVAQGEWERHPAGLVAGRTPHGLVALCAVADPVRFHSAARDEGRWPVLYKADGRAAARARAAGLAVLPIARDAWLCPQDFHLEIPARAGLRRKLRRAAAAGVAAALDDAPDWVALAQVNAAWVAARGGEHGFSMGRFDPSYCAGQRVVVARQRGRVVGFATFHTARMRGGAVWTLDLLRPDPAAPEGTAQLLVTAAVEAARAAGVGRLSLAAAPLGASPAERGPAAWLGRWLAPAAMGGLAQFKAGFAPDWRRVYMVGPSWPVLALIGWEIWQRVRHPPPLSKMRQTTRRDAEYEFASARNPWQRESDKAA
jgi:phosphatidylglycerol lysyltransferase